MSKVKNRVENEIDALIGKPWKKEDTYNENQYSFYESDKEAVLAIIKREVKLAYEQGGIQARVGIGFTAKNDSYNTYVTTDGDTMYNLAAVRKERKLAKIQMTDLILGRIQECCCDSCLNAMIPYLDWCIKDLEKDNIIGDVL